MAREFVRRARSTRWLGCLVLWSALVACRGSGPSEEAPSSPPPRMVAVDGGLPVLAEGEVRRAQRRPDGGTPDAGPFRYEMEGVPHPEATKGTEPCPPGYHRCCEGSCSPDKRCPGVACDPVPTMSE
jgi:hypothetical protein